MSSLYHSRGFWRGLIRQPAWHLREYWRSSAYRALHRFHWQLHRQPRRIAAKVSFEGRMIRLCDAASFLSAWDEIFVNRIYEIRAGEQSIPCLVDAGANIGLAALFWKWRYGRVKYLGFEPDPRIAACCRENLKTWDIGGELIEAAVGAYDGMANFVPDGADGGRMANSHEGEASMLAVPVKRLGPCLPERVDLLKIDVEGAEANVIEDLVPYLDRVQTLFVEWHSRAGDLGLGDMIAQIEGAGYDCFFQVASGPPQPFLSKPSRVGFCQHLNIYAVRHDAR